MHTAGHILPKTVLYVLECLGDPVWKLLLFSDKIQRVVVAC